MDMIDDHLRALLKAYDFELYKFIASRVKFPDNEDVRQDAVIKALNGLKRMPEEELQSLHLPSWLYEVAKDTIRDYYRKQRRVPSIASVSLLDTDEQDIEDKTCDCPEELIEQADNQAQQRTELRKLLALLPEKYRTALVLRKIENQRYDHIAAIVGQPEEMVRAHVQNAMRCLRRAAVSQQVK